MATGPSERPASSQPGVAYSGVSPTPAGAAPVPSGVAPPARPPKTSPWAIASLVAALAPVVLFPLAGMLSEALGGFVSLILLPGPLLAILFGALGLHQVRREPHAYRGRGLALTGLIIGIVEIVLAIVLIILVVIIAAAIAAACAAAFASCGSGAQLVGVAASTPKRTARSRWGGVFRAATAHHPACPHFDADVLRFAGLRVCASCSAMASAMFATTMALAFLPPISSTSLLIAALGLGAAELAARVGLTRTRRSKVAVKFLFGAGLALGLHGLVAAPWSAGAKAALVAGGLGLMLLLVPLRTWFLEHACRRAHGPRETPATL